MGGGSDSRLHSISRDTQPCDLRCNTRGLPEATHFAEKSAEAQIMKCIVIMLVGCPLCAG